MPVPQEMEPYMYLLKQVCEEILYSPIFISAPAEWAVITGAY